MATTEVQNVAAMTVISVEISLCTTILCSADKPVVILYDCNLRVDVTVDNNSNVIYNIFFNLSAATVSSNMHSNLIREVMCEIWFCQAEIRC